MGGAGFLCNYGHHYGENMSIFDVQAVTRVLGAYFILGSHGLIGQNETQQGGAGDLFYPGHYPVPRHITLYTGFLSGNALFSFAQSHKTLTYQGF